VKRCWTHASCRATKLSKETYKKKIRRREKKSSLDRAPQKKREIKEKKVDVDLHVVRNKTQNTKPKSRSTVFGQGQRGERSTVTALLTKTKSSLL